MMLYTLSVFASLLWSVQGFQLTGLLSSSRVAALPLLSIRGEIPKTTTRRRPVVVRSNGVAMNVAASSSASSSSYLFMPAERDSHYGSNIAQYLVDLHDSKTTFNFCGGMMFQLVLSDKLREYLVDVATKDQRQQQPVIFDATHPRMSRIPEYSQSAYANNVQIFHGREIRKVPNAAGGMGFVLQLSHSEDDPQGWTAAEVEGYDGWGHDSGRVWRTGDRLESEGFNDFRQRFGPDSFALHHRFYLHMDNSDRMWLSAEDGCEGTPAPGGGIANRIAALMGLGG